MGLIPITFTKLQLEYLAVDTDRFFTESFGYSHLFLALYPVSGHQLSGG